MKVSSTYLSHSFGSLSAVTSAICSKSSMKSPTTTRERDFVLTLVSDKVEYKDLPAIVKHFQLLVLSGASGVRKSVLAQKLCIL